METDVENRAASLQNKLRRLLEGEDIDFDRFVKLSSELAKEDQDKVRFSADAALISRLGRELVSRQETAVSELIKNAYDADARRAELIFDNTKIEGGTLEIIDDGHGMDRDQLINGFMRLSSMDKVENPISPKYGRSRAGKKGIGRFAAQRLGEHLEITTQTADADHALRVKIDWTEFQGGRDLSSISNNVEIIPKEQSHGTTLVISNLREAWTKAAVRRIYRYTSDIIQPFPLSEQVEGDDRDPGFKIDIFRKTGDDIETVADEQTEVLQHALAVIKGHVDAEGNGSWSIESDRLEIKEEGKTIGKDRHDDRLSFENLSDISFEAYYFIHESNLIPHGLLGLIQELGREKGGIRIYRNGFRVLPYGEEFDDWLNIDQSYQRRVILPPHGTNNFFGFVEIIHPEDSQFQETSSREGLIENEAFEELQDFVYRVLLAGVVKVAEARGRKQTARQKDWKGTDAAKEAVSRARDRLNKAKESDTSGDTTNVSTDIEAVQADLDIVEEGLSRAEEETQRLLEMNGMLRVLGSLGLTIGEFTHEIKSSFGSVMADANWLAERLDAEQKAKKRATRLRDNVGKLETYTQYFDRTVSDNVDRSLKPQNLRDVINNFIQITESMTDKYDLRIKDPVYEAHDLYTCPMHSSEWPSILLNFFTNSLKATRGVKRNGEIFLRAGEEGEKVFVEFHDNGKGIPEENRERVFDEFFTTTTPAGQGASDDEMLRGSGLGLKIVSDIVSAYGGDVFVDAPAEGYQTCMRVEFPKATDEELEEYDL